MSSSASPTVVPPKADFAWDKLAFDLFPTNGYAKYVWADGKWGPVEWVKEPYLKLHVGSGELAAHEKKLGRGAELTSLGFAVGLNYG